MSDDAARPPKALLRSLATGPSRVAGIEWHAAVDSTMRLAREAAAAGAPEIGVIGADVQTAGRGRHGRAWRAPAGTSLQLSFLLRPQVPEKSLTLLSLLAGVVVAEVAAAHVPDAEVALKWPNDLFVDGAKAAGVLVERVPDAAVVGVGVNVDWRGVERPPELAGAGSLAEAAGRAVDRWKVLAGLVGVLDRRYAAWQDDPPGVLEAYRRWCATPGQLVEVTGLDGSVRRGTATGIADDGALLLAAAGATTKIHAGDVTHLRAGPATE